jgi:DNA polymerase III alpha subunit
LSSVDLAWEYAQSQANNLHQVGLFDAGHGAHSEEPHMRVSKPWTIRERLTQEKSALGFHLSGHLFEEYVTEVRKFIKRPLSELTETKDPQWVVGMVKNYRFINTSRGKLHIFEMDDMSDVFELSADETIFNANKHNILEDQLLVAQVKVQADRRDPTQLRLSLIQSLSLTESRCRFGKYLQCNLKENIQDADSASSLIDSLQVRKFDWKTDQTHQRYGFIAQELVTVAPEAVHQPEDPEEMMAVDYSKLVPMLVKEIQSLRQRLSAANL